MESLIWIWPAGVPAHCDLQHTPQAKSMLPAELDMPDHAAQLCAQGRLTRVATFRQLQAISNTFRQTGLWNGINDFQLHADYDIGEVEDGEVRIVQAGEDYDYAVRAQVEPIDPTTGGHAYRVLPDSALAPNAEQYIVGHQSRPR